MDCDLADDELQRIVRMKEDVTGWLDDIRAYFHNSGTAKRDDYAQWELGHEQEFDERFHAEWHRLTKISGSVEWSREIPSCEVIRAQVAKEKMQARRPVLTNPATGKTNVSW